MFCYSKNLLKKLTGNYARIMCRDNFVSGRFSRKSGYGYFTAEHVLRRSVYFMPGNKA
ncbi:MAG: hypothetical protein K0S33_3223 [Bacteroidetes bacterium]|jgi:hypothetical protein|nr:hypothetical protein [Bacteroidota bacterium]